MRAEEAEMDVGLALLPGATRVAQPLLARRRQSRTNRGFAAKGWGELCAGMCIHGIASDLPSIRKGK